MKWDPSEMLRRLRRLMLRKTLTSGVLGFWFFSANCLFFYNTRDQFQLVAINHLIHKTLVMPTLFIASQGLKMIRNLILILTTFEITSTDW